MSFQLDNLILKHFTRHRLKTGFRYKLIRNFSRLNLFSAKNFIESIKYSCVM